jgi:hypothetical protein
MKCKKHLNESLGAFLLEILYIDGVLFMGYQVVDFYNISLEAGIKKFANDLTAHRIVTTAAVLEYAEAVTLIQFNFGTELIHRLTAVVAHNHTVIKQTFAFFANFRHRLFLLCVDVDNSFSLRDCLQ